MTNFCGPHCIIPYSYEHSISLPVRLLVQLFWPSTKGLVAKKKRCHNNLFTEYWLVFCKTTNFWFWKIVHKGIFSEFDLEVNAPQKKHRKSSFPDILKLFFLETSNNQHLISKSTPWHSSPSICRKNFESLPLQTLLWRWWRWGTTATTLP